MSYRSNRPIRLNHGLVPCIITMYQTYRTSHAMSPVQADKEPLCDKPPATGTMNKDDAIAQWVSIVTNADKSHQDEPTDLWGTQGVRRIDHPCRTRWWSDSTYANTPVSCRIWAGASQTSGASVYKLGPLSRLLWRVSRGNFWRTGTNVRRNMPAATDSVVWAVFLVLALSVVLKVGLTTHSCRPECCPIKTCTRLSAPGGSVVTVPSLALPDLCTSRTIWSCSQPREGPAILYAPDARRDYSTPRYTLSLHAEPGSSAGMELAQCEIPAYRHLLPITHHVPHCQSTPCDEQNAPKDKTSRRMYNRQDFTSSRSFLFQDVAIRIPTRSSVELQPVFSEQKFTEELLTHNKVRATADEVRSFRTRKAEHSWESVSPGDSESCNLATCQSRNPLQGNLLYWVGNKTVQSVDGASYRERPKSADVLKGDTVTLHCTIDGLPPSEMVQWYGPPDMRHISSGNVIAKRFKGRYRILGDTSRGEHNLQILRAANSDEGEYRCSTLSLDETADATLTVVVPLSGPPDIIGDTAPRKAGQGLMLTCTSVGGRPPPRLTWYNGTRPYKLPDDAFKEGINKGEVMLNLVIPYLTKWDNGANLSCKADQGFPSLVKPRTAVNVLNVRCKYHVQRKAGLTGR
ncbi:cell differentiation [Branchiostoma belcheri]|nr:cell differentiation [Branchiostoma belcheri]